MPARPDVPYSPTPSVAPEIGSGNDLLSVRADPNAFGAQVGEATQKFGAQVGQVENNAVDLAVQHQGMLNETIATDSETQGVAKTGTVVGKFKSLEGLAAVAAAPQAIADVTAIRQNIASGIANPAARRSFTTLMLRHEGYALQDINSYAAAQVKQADTNSAKASAELSINRAGDLSVAQDDTRFSDVLKDSDFQTARIVTNQGYGADGGTGMKQDPATGDVTFDETTPAGKAGKAVYDNMRDTAHGMAWENRLHTLSDQNVLSAYKVYQDNRSQIPGDMQAKLDAYFTPKVRGAQAASAADTVLANTDAQYKSDLNNSVASAGAPNPNNLGNVKSGAGFAAPASPVDGAILTANTLRNNYQGLSLSDIGKKWEGTTPTNIANWVSNVSKSSGISPDAVPNLNDPAVLKSLLGGIATAEKSPSDRAAFTDDVIGKGAQASIAGQKPQTSTAPPNGKLYQSQADYYRANYASILGQVRQQADQLHPDDPTFSDQSVARAEQKIGNVIRQQELSQKADSDTVFQAFNGSLSQGSKPTSIEQLTAISPDVKSAWDRMQADNPQAAAAVENRILTANSKETGSDAKTYGPGFYDVYRQMNLPPSDPNRITDPKQLWDMGGADGKLTVAGIDKLTKVMADKGTPQGDADHKMQEQFFANAHKQLSYQDDSGYVKDPKGEENYLRFMTHAFGAIDDGKKAGKTSAQLFNPDSPDYIGKSIATFKRSHSQEVADGVAGGVDDLKLDPVFTKPDLTTPDGLKEALRTKHITLDQAKDIALRHNWISRDAAPLPAAPMQPSVSAPNAVQ